jgi:hypothetical protein
MLEGENRAELTAEVAPSPRGDTSEKRQFPGGAGQGFGFEEGLFKAEGHPIIELVVQSANVLRTPITGAAGARSQHSADIAGLGEVFAIGEIERPASIATGRVSLKYAREWKT